MDDESDTIAELEDRIEQLEATTRKMMPTRRDALKFGGAAAIGAAAMSGTASAGSSQVGTIGDASNLVDVQAEDIDVDDTLTTQDLVVNGTATGPFGGGGITFSEGDSINVLFDDAFTVSGSSFHTVFDLSSGVDVYGGGIYGFNLSNIRITFGSGTTTRIGSDGSNARGEDFAGNQYSLLSLFPMEDVKKLEFYNDASDSKVYGYRVYTT